MASSARFSLEQTSALSRPPGPAGRVAYDPKAAPRIRVSTIPPSPDVRPLECGPSASSHFSRLRSRSSLNPLDAWRPPTFIKPSWRAVESSRYCAGAVPAGGVAAGFSPVRRPWRRSWRPCLRSLRWVRRPCRRCIPWVPVAGAGAAAGAAASCASASSGSSADDSVKPSAAPTPSSDSAFRREIISILASSFISGLPVTHDRPIGSAVGRTPAIVRRPERQSEIALRLERPSCRNSLPARDDAESPRLAIVAPANTTTKLRLN
jgi:hypothetical protein